MLRNSKDRFGLIHKGFHWSMGVLILLMLSVGFWMAELDFSPFKLEIYALHKSFGVLILMLLAARIMWRLFDKRPKPVPTLKWWEDALAKLVHFALYFAIFAMVMTGLTMSAAGEFPVTFFGLFEIPPLTEKNEDAFEFLRDMHELWALVILGLLSLHFAGAFKHHFIDKDETLKRMTWMSLGFKGGVVLALVIGVLWIKPVLLFAESSDDDDAIELAEEQVENEHADGAWKIDDKESFIKFVMTQQGAPVEGRFEDFDADIVFDPDNLSEASVTVSIEIDSINTGSKDRDEQALQADWFDENAFGKATFTSQNFEHKDANHYIAHGVLMLRGKAVPLDLPFKLDISGEGEQTAAMSAEIMLNRLEYRIGQGQWSSTDTIGGDVKVTIYVKASRKE